MGLSNIARLRVTAPLSLLFLKLLAVKILSFFTNKITSEKGLIKVAP